MLDNQLIALIISTIVAGEAAAGIPGTPIKQAFQPTQQGVNSQPTGYLYKIGDRRVGTPRRSDVWAPVQSAAFTGSISGTMLIVSALASGNINVGDVLFGSGVPANITIASLGSGTGGTGTYNLSTSLSISSEAMTSATMTMVHTELQKYETTFQISALATQNPTTPTQYTASDIVNLIAYILQSSVAINTFQASNVGIERIMDVRNPYFMDDRQRFEASPSLDFVLAHDQIITTATPIVNAEELQILTV
jgi:hypothetical protein